MLKLLFTIGGKRKYLIVKDQIFVSKIVIRGGVENDKKGRTTCPPTADAIVEVMQLKQLLEEAGTPVKVGSAALGLMVWRDLDITVVCSKLNIATISGIASQLMSVLKSAITNSSMIRAIGTLIQPIPTVIF